MTHFSENNYKELFEQYHKKVFNISLNIVHSIEDAEDITQEVFIEVYHSLSSFKEQSSFATWIYRIAVNKSLDFLRSKKRKKRFAFFTQLFHPETGEQLQEVSHFNHPGVELENKERSFILYKAIDKLPDHQKTAFVLSQIEALSQKEIAAITWLSEKAVESLIQRAKGNLRQQLGKMYHERRI